MDRLGPGSIYRFLAPVVEVGVSGETRVGRQTCSGLIIALALEGKCLSLLAADPRALRHQTLKGWALALCLSPDRLGSSDHSVLNRVRWVLWAVSHWAVS